LNKRFVIKFKGSTTTSSTVVYIYSDNLLTLATTNSHCKLDSLLNSSLRC